MWSRALAPRRTWGRVACSLTIPAQARGRLWRVAVAVGPVRFHVLHVPAEWTHRRPYCPGPCHRLEPHYHQLTSLRGRDWQSAAGPKTLGPWAVT